MRIILPFAVFRNSSRIFHRWLPFPTGRGGFFHAWFSTNSTDFSTGTWRFPCQIKVFLVENSVNNGNFVFYLSICPQFVDKMCKNQQLLLGEHLKHFYNCRFIFSTIYISSAALALSAVSANKPAR
jgi:hypothetical protein